MWRDSLARTTWQPPPRVGEYEIGRELGRGSMSVVHEAIRDDELLAIKILTVTDGDDVQARRRRFLAEAATVARLNHPSLIRIIETGEVDDLPFFIMSLAEGQDLSSRLAQGPMTEDEALTVAESLAGALMEVHRFGLVHRDIKPANIMVRSTGEAQLIDFGLVAPGGDADMVVGTLEYASPEQLGVLNRAVGARADLYSLGVTLYECVTGEPPFSASDSSRFFQALATQAAPDLRTLRPEISSAFSMVVSQLLAKDPDDRYQSAGALLADLEAFDDLVDAVDAERPVVLGARGGGAAGRVALIGRDGELQRLQRVWRSCTRGVGRFAQIEGEGGSGKSRLVQELIQGIEPGRLQVLWGKSQEHETVPFGPLREAVDGYLDSLRALDEDQRAVRIGWLKHAAGDMSELVGRLSVRLHQVLGKGDRMRALEPDAEQQRYYEALAGFLAALGQPEAPLLLVLDDVQWLDEASVMVLKRLAAMGADSHAMVISTSRNESAYEAPRLRFLAAVQPLLATRVVLRTLDEDGVDALIQALLGGRPLERATVQVLARKTRGNPFAVGEYLRALIEAGVLHPSEGRWLADATALEELGLPEDVVDLVLSRIDPLAPRTAHILGVAAIIGSRFPVELLAQVSNHSETEFARIIEEMVHAGLVQTQDGHEYVFIHDRVREAAETRLDPRQRKDAHQSIAEALATREDLCSTMRYAMATHYAAGHVDHAPERAAMASLVAGRLALEEHAYEQAFLLLDRAMDFFGRADSFDEHALEVLEGLGRACAMTGRLERAFSHLEDALGYASSRTDRFRVQHLLTLTYASQGRNDEALEALYRAFEVAWVHRRFPRNSVVQILSILLIWPLALLFRWTGFRRGRATGAELEQRRVLSQLHYAGSMIALFQGRPILMVQFVVRDFYNVHFLPRSPEKAIASTVYGAVMGMFRLDPVMRHYTTMGVEMADQLGDRAAMAVSRAYKAVGTKWSGDLPGGNEQLAAALPDLNRYVPGSWYAAMMIAEQAYSLLHAGHARDAVAHVRASKADLDRTHNLMFRYNTVTVQYAELMVAGEVAEAAQMWEGLERDFAPLSSTIYVGLARCIAVLEVLIDQGEVGPAVDATIRDFDHLVSEDYYSNAARMLGGYARLAQFEAAAPSSRGSARRKLRRAILALSVRAMVPVFAVHPLIWRAALARHDGRLGAAIRLLVRAERLARRADSPRAHFHIALERARVERIRGDQVERFYVGLALEIAEAEGWTQKTAMVRSEFGLEATVSSAGRGDRDHSPVPRAVVHTRRYAKVLLDISLGSANSVDDEVIARNALVEVGRVLGAERSLLFLIDPATSSVRLRASVGPAPERISMTVVRRVIASRAPVVVTGTDEGQELDSESFVTAGLRSVMAVPLMLRDQLMGVVYLDSRIAKGIFNEDDVNLLLGVSNHIAIAVQSARNVRLESKRAAMQRDYELLGAVQSLLLPQRSTIEFSGVKGEGYYMPATHCGGDWWWSEAQPDGTLMVIIGDVSGHGAASAMITSAVAGTIHTLREVEPGAAPSRILDVVNTRLLSFGGGFHMTMSIAVIDSVRRSVRWTNAGGPPGFLIHAGHCSALALPGSVLGYPGDLELGELTVDFAEGDTLVLCTDGLLEMKPEAGRELGARQVSMTLERLANDLAQPVGPALDQWIRAKLGDCEQDDDITFVVLQAGDRAETGFTGSFLREVLS